MLLMFRFSFKLTKCSGLTGLTMVFSYRIRNIVFTLPVISETINTKKSRHSFLDQT